MRGISLALDGYEKFIHNRECRKMEQIGKPELTGDLQYVTVSTPMVGRVAH